VPGEFNMPMRRGFLAAGYALTAATFLAPAPAEACSCAQAPCSVLLRAHSVVEATVDSITPANASPVAPPWDSRSSDVTVALRDVRVVRGVAIRTVVTSDVAGCGVDFVVGQRYFIVASRAGDGRYVTYQCGFTQPIGATSQLETYLDSRLAPPRGGTVLGRAWVPTPEIIRGRSRSAPAAGAPLTLVGPVTRTTTVTADGQFAFTALPPGQYVLRGEVPGFERFDRSAGPVLTVPDVAYACEYRTVRLPAIQR
jgi:hypothetical protein